MIAPTSIAALLLSTSMAIAQEAAPAAEAPKPAANARILDTRSARTVGLAPGWQSKLPVLAGNAIQGIRLVPAADGKPENDWLYAWDRAGVVMKVDPRSGEVRWTSASIARGSGVGLLDVFSAQLKDRTVVVGLGDDACLALDGRTGSEEGLTSYARIPATTAVRSGNEFVYGSRAGQVVWMTMREEAIPKRQERKMPNSDPSPQISAIHVIPYETRAHAMSGSISVPPVIAGESIVACSSQGQVTCFLGDSKRIGWQLRLPGGIVATPAASDTQIFIPCTDQYLRCVQLEPTSTGSVEEGTQKRLLAGAVAWKWFTETPLVHPPLFSGNLVVIQVDGLGLVALDADPTNASLDRKPLWISKAPGDAIARSADGFVLWDAASSTLTLVDASTGAVRNASKIPDAQIVTSTAATDGDLLIVAVDGRLQRCPALNPLKKQQAKPKAEGHNPKEPTASDAPETQAAAPAAAESSAP